MKMMKKIRKGSALCLVLTLVLSTVILSKVQAAIGIETERKCSVVFKLDGEYTELKELKIPVHLYKVADVAESGEYTELKGFESLDLKSISEETTAEEWEKKAEDAAKVVEEQKPEATAESVLENGEGKVAGLATGMYLVSAESVQSPYYVYDFTPYLISLPNNYYYNEGNENGDAWVYDVTTGLKPGQTDRYGNLVIDKTLTSFNTSLGNATFVFSVEAVKEDEVVYSDVVSLVFDGAGTKSVEIAHIPAGASVTVTEVYSGASYEAVSDTTQSTVIIAGEEQGNPVHVAFENEYNSRLNGGTSVVNKFAYNDGTWDWQQQTDSSGAQE